MIAYTDSPAAVTADKLTGFFVGWPNPPSPQTHLKLLHGSDAVELAIDAETQRVVGFATGMTDGVLSLYISYLEVLPEYQRRGIGTQLIQRLLKRFSGLYDACTHCDRDVQPFFGRLGLEFLPGMVIRRYERQSGA